MLRSPTYLDYNDCIKLSILLPNFTCTVGQHHDVLGDSSLDTLLNCADSGISRGNDYGCCNVGNNDGTCSGTSRNSDTDNIEMDHSYHNVDNDGTCLANDVDNISEVKLTSQQWLVLFAKYDLSDLQSELQKVDPDAYDHKYKDYHSDDLYELLGGSRQHFFNYLVSVGLTASVVLNIQEESFRNRFVTVRKKNREVLIQSIQNSMGNSPDSEHSQVSEMIDSFLCSSSGSPASSSCSSPSIDKGCNNDLKATQRNTSEHNCDVEYNQHNDHGRMRNDDYNTCLRATSYYFPGIILHSDSNFFVRLLSIICVNSYCRSLYFDIIFILFFFSCSAHRWIYQW